MKTPLQVVVVRDFADQRLDIYVDTLRLAFEGSADSSGSPYSYISEAVDLGIRVLEPVGQLGQNDVIRLLGGARHTILVLIGDQSNNESLLKESVGEGNILNVPSPPRNLRDYIQGKKAADGVEPAFAPVVTALRAMNLSRKVLFQSIDAENRGSANLKLFISHAKLDGLAMAKSLIGLLRQFQEVDKGQSNFDYFYDDEHIEPGTIWKNILESEVSSSILIVLRTEAYENRYWCRSEYIWAEKHGMPIIIVDLRKEQFHDGALLPFDVAPTVRVHDGNLIRIILHAFSRHLRVLRVMSEVSIGVQVMPNRPSVYSISEVCRLGGGNYQLAYPGPRLSEAFIRAVDPILSQAIPPLQLVTYDEVEGR